MGKSFDFTTWIGDGIVYTAKQTHSGSYVVFQKGHTEVDSAIWEEEDLEYAISHGYWVKVIYNKDNFFSIKQGQIEAAARFIVANNKHMHHHTVDSVSSKIKKCIKEMINKINSGKESYYFATAGFVITIRLEDDNYYVVEVLVSPDVSSDEEFVNVEEII